MIHTRNVNLKNLSSTISVDYALCSTGIIFICLGMYRFFSLLASPENPFGALLYILIGLPLALTYSKHLRLMIIDLLSPKFKSLLYEKSLMEIFTQPSPYFRGLIVIGMSIFLEEYELTQLINSLPRNCHIFKRKGLIHLLPKSVIAFTIIIVFILFSFFLKGFSFHN